MIGVATEVEGEILLELADCSNSPVARLRSLSVRIGAINIGQVMLSWPNC